MVRRWFLAGSVLLVLGVVGLSLVWPQALFNFLLLGPIIGLGCIDAMSTKHTILRNFPLIGRVQHFGELYDFLEPGQLLRDEQVPKELREAWRAACPDRWSALPQSSRKAANRLRAGSAIIISK